jgi:histidinol-phosphate aminotransferase
MNNNIINLQYTTIKDPLPDFIYEGLADYSSYANSYQPQPQKLIEKLAQKHNLSPEMIYLTAGIDEAIQIFAKAYGQNAYVFTPSYVVYADVEEFGGKLTRLQSIVGDKFKISTDTIKGATLIYLANPNNPSGFTSKDRVLDLIKNNQESIVCIDEAYGEFAHELSVIDLVQKFPKLVVFRSFSKDYGMAGNRIGYFMAHPEVIKDVKNKIQWANVSYLSVGAAIIALDHEEYFGKMRQNIQKRRSEFMVFLNEVKLKYLPSKINAVLLKFASKEKGTNFADFLKTNNFIISHGNGSSNIGLDESFVRISIGNENQMQALKETIKKYK